MAIELLPATVDDVEAMVDTGMAAFADDALANAQFRLKELTPGQANDYRAWRIQLTKARVEGAGKFWTKAVDSTQGVVGYVGIFSPHVLGPDPLDIPKPSSMAINQEVYEEFQTKMKIVKDRHLGDRDDYYYVQSMVVHPDFQGHGLATNLLQSGLMDVDRAGQDVYLEGTARAKRLYLRCGFEILEEVQLETVNYTFLAMIRRSKTEHGAL